MEKMAFGNGSHKRGFLRPGGGSRLPLFVIIGLIMACTLLLYNLYAATTAKSFLIEELALTLKKLNACNRDKTSVETKLESQMTVCNSYKEQIQRLKTSAERQASAAQNDLKVCKDKNDDLRNQQSNLNDDQMKKLEMCEEQRNSITTEFENFKQECAETIKKLTKISTTTPLTILNQEKAEEHAAAAAAADLVGAGGGNDDHGTNERKTEHETKVIDKKPETKIPVDSNDTKPKSFESALKNESNRQKLPDTERVVQPSASAIKVEQTAETGEELARKSEIDTKNNAILSKPESLNKQIAGDRLSQNSEMLPRGWDMLHRQKESTTSSSTLDARSPVADGELASADDGGKAVRPSGKNILNKHRALSNKAKEKSAAVEEPRRGRGEQFEFDSNINAKPDDGHIQETTSARPEDDGNRSAVIASTITDRLLNVGDLAETKKFLGRDGNHLNQDSVIAAPAAPDDVKPPAVNVQPAKGDDNYREDEDDDNDDADDLNQQHERNKIIN